MDRIFVGAFICFVGGLSLIGWSFVPYNMGYKDGICTERSRLCAKYNTQTTDYKKCVSTNEFCEVGEKFDLRKNKNITTKNNKIAPPTADK